MRKIKRPTLGEYVLLSKWSDKDIYDPWAIGFLYGIQETEDGIHYRTRDDKRWFPHCWRITPAEASERFDWDKFINPQKEPENEDG